jgi:DNA helicase-2/ATP-dependent DNA helicase PcrA
MVVKLERNYRSTQTILDAANAIISRNRDRHVKRLWTEAGSGDLIELYAAGDERGEAYFVASKIRQLLDDGPLSPGDFAILYRTNAQSRVLEEHLRAARVPAKVIGAVSFFERKEVKDTIAYLRLLANANADSAFERIVNVPPRGLGETTVDRLRAAAKACSWNLYEAAQSAARGQLAGVGAAPRRKLQGFVELVDGLRDVVQQGASVAETIIQIVDRSGLRARLEADDSSESRDRLDNLAELVTIATDFDDEAEQPQTIDAFLERIALAAPSDQSADRDQVVLMTIHVAKGLEWPVVFLTGLEDGVFPSLRGRDDQSEDAALEEERRLAYVALTRARERLVISHARTRRVWGEIRVQQPSRFLADLPPAGVVEPQRRNPPALGPRIVDGNFAKMARGSAAGSRRMSASRDELDQRAPDDDVPVYQVDADVPGDGFRSGDQVTHARHGRGRVVSVTGMAGDERVVVEFATVGRMTVLARYLATDDVN